MTFLLFLASLAVVEYLVRDIRHKSSPWQKSFKGSNESSNRDLLSLAQALSPPKPIQAPESKQNLNVEAK